MLSFLEDGSEFFIEVKTTNGAKETPFFISANELGYAALHGPHYPLYRLFNFGLGPRLFVIAGDPRDTLAVEPTERAASTPSGDDEMP